MNDAHADKLLQYNELAKLCDSGATTTPPLSLASSPGRKQRKVFPTQTAVQILRASDQQDAAIKVEAGIKAAHALRNGMPKRPDLGVRIWSGPSADSQEGGSALHSISESPLEQDFTIEGKPSKLGCPFASMANKKLSSHAASVLSRYKTGSTAASGSQLGSDSVNKVNGKESLSRRGSRRASFMDPIKAEICGLSDHEDRESPHAERAPQPTGEAQEEPGVCPIRFLDQHSPEEVATYFEKHKHELPRSHEMCVKRYQSNEQQIRELDEKYGNLVSMIQGLGAKHKGLLPPEPEDEDELAIEDGELDAKEVEKVRQWASSVSARVGDGEAAAYADDEDGDGDEARQQHFERPLRDIRVGESPSRPWGISVPPRYAEKEGSVSSSRPAQATSSDIDAEAQNDARKAKQTQSAKGKCPFGFDQVGLKTDTTAEAKAQAPAPEQQKKSVFVQRDNPGLAPASSAPKEQQLQSPRMVFSGPVFIGYSAEDAAKVLRESGLGGQT